MLGVPLVVVMGHEACGAVKAAMDVVDKNAKFPGSIGTMIEPIVPAVLAARGRPGDRTEQAIRALAARGTPLVAILWGRDARSLRPLLRGVPAIESAHPSPMSADRGFFGSRPFSRANALLAQQGAPPVDWKLP